MLLIVLGLAVISGFNMTTLKLLLLVALWWLSSPVASHLIGKLEVTTQEDLDAHMAVRTEGDVGEEVDG